jgi:ABC-2 type transport system ATP-binding protein
VAPALRFAGVHKRFGKRRALDGLDLEIPAGSCFGLIGPNGAGKTTAFSLACGFLRPDAGEVEILGGRGFELPRLKGRVGALPQDAALGRETRCREHLLYFGRLGGLSEAEAQRQADLRLAEVGLSDRAGARVKTLSHGMLRRLAVAQALLGTPDLVLLDEPTSGLDPRHAHELRELLARMRDGDQLRTVVISSHNLHELERLCDHVAFMDAGVVRTAGATELVTGRGQEVEITLGPGPAPVAALEAALAGAQLAQARVGWDEGSRKVQLSFPPGEQRQPEEVVTLALKALIDAGARISEVRRGSTLEQKFLGIS